MNLYIDCEWNGFEGDLISMALVAENGKEWYEELGCENPVDWVAENVMPHLTKKAVDKSQMQNSLAQFLLSLNTPVNIVADWPEDIERFCALLITGPGERIETPPLSMQIVRIEAESVIPHNALEDARGIRRALTTTA